MNQRLLKLFIPVLSFLICVLSVEFILSFFYPVNESYYTQRPNQKYFFESDSLTLKGTSKTTNLNFNSFGARSNEIPRSKTHQILAFGGSTTECALLDQNKTWTTLLENFLNKDNDSISFWVGNFGKAGNDTNHHSLQTEKMLENEVLKDSKTLLYLIGFNDLIRAIDLSDKYVNPDPYKIKISGFMIVPDKDLPYYRRSAIWKFLKDTKFKINIRTNDPKKLAKIHKDVRLKRKQRKKDSILPDLTRGLSHYKDNVRNIISICRSEGKRPVFLTQPVLWRPDISEEGANILYTFFQKNENNNLSIKALYECMKIFNKALIDVCIETNVQCIDLFSYSKENWFYDDCHFAEKGALEIAKIIANEINL